MNNDAEAMQQFVVWLLQTLDPANGEPSGDWNQAAEPEQTGSVHLQSSAELLSSEAKAGMLESIDPSIDPQPAANSQDVSMPLDEELSPFAFGDLPAVQQRFHALLKHRLKTEIERNPPRFPWETEQHDYQYDNQYDYSYDPSCSYDSCSEVPLDGGRSDSPLRQPVPVPEPALLWAAHFKTLNLPIALPDAVLQTLFEQCRQLVQSSLREGRRLVQAAESLFPEEGAALNQLAGLVLASPLRGSVISPPRSGSNLPTDYNQASRPQQMVLSLLAARQMFEAMTLSLSSDSPTLDRVWLTKAGAMMLAAQYFPESGTVQIKADLPSGGTVQFQQAALESIAACNLAGQVSVSLGPLQIDQSATLTIALVGSEVPLVFAVRLA